MSKSAKLKGEVATVVVQTASETGDRETLAGCPADEEVDASILVLSYRGEVAVQRHVRVVILQDGAGECFDFGKECRLPAKRVPCGGCGFDAAAHGTVPHCAAACMIARSSGFIISTRGTA